MYTFGRPATIFALSFSLFLLSGSDRLRADEATPVSPFGQMVNSLNPANWKMPSFQGLMPQTQEKAKIKKKKDGLVDEVGKTASSSWNRTKEAFNPQKLNPANFFTASAKSPADTTPAPKKPGFFQSLFSPSVPQDENATMSGFLNQDRPTP
jgi:hypothetical protein